MRLIIKLIAMALVIFAAKLFFIGKAEAGGPWSDQYCDVETTQIRVIDTDGNLLESKVEEKVVCNDGASDFLFDMGIADSCQMFTWDMPIGETVITQRDIACHKLNGEYEIVSGYHSLD